MADDYMSDALLGGLPAPKVSRTVQRLRDRRHGPPRQQPVTQLQEERRSEGLQAPIPQDNKGFQMLARMGYQPGTGLGKAQAEAGAAPAIPLVVKRDRQGLGSSADTADRRKAQRQQDSTSATEAYRQQLHSQLATKKLRRDFQKYLAMCQALDEAAGRILSPFLDSVVFQRSLQARQPGPCFGGVYDLPDGRTVFAARPRLGDPERWLCALLPELRPVTVLRAELTARVAGPPESAAAHPIAHQLAQEWCREDAAGPAAEFTDEDVRLGWPDLAAYLRATHTVCVYCGAQYASAEELQALCPGPAEEHHDAGTVLDDD